MNLSECCRQLLVVHKQVRDYQVEALMVDTLDQIGRIRRQEGLARQERRDLCRLIRDEVRLRMAAYEQGRKFTQMEVQAHKRGSRGK
jgi:hypothetical protein